MNLMHTALYAYVELNIWCSCLCHWRCH